MTVEPYRRASRYFDPGHHEGEPPADRILVRDLELGFRIGVYEHEKQGPQRVRVNLEIEVAPADMPEGDDISGVVSYEKVVDRIAALAEGRHINLVETLAERIAAICLEDPRARRARVRVEKLDVVAAASAVGVEIERRRTWHDGRHLERGPAEQEGVIQAFEPRRSRGGAD